MKTAGFKGYSVFFNFLLSSADINRDNSFKLSTSLFSHVNLNSKGAKGHSSDSHLNMEGADMVFSISKQLLKPK